MGFWKRLFTRNETILSSSNEQKNFTVCLIDDDEMIRKTFELYYRNIHSKPDFEHFPYAFNIHTFAKSDELLKFLSTQPVDLVLVDYYLDTDDDFSSGNELRQAIVAGYPQLRIAMLSGLEDGKKVLELIQKGVRDYVIKNNEMYDNINAIILDMTN